VIVSALLQITITAVSTLASHSNEDDSELFLCVHMSIEVTVKISYLLVIILHCKYSVTIMFLSATTVSLVMQLLQV